MFSSLLGSNHFGIAGYYSMMALEHNLLVCIHNPLNYSLIIYYVKEIIFDMKIKFDQNVHKSNFS